MYFGMFDPTIVILIPAMIFALYAQGKVKSAYNRYAQINNRRGITGHQAARMILDANGLRHVPVEMTAGTLTDHYDPKNDVMRLSSEVYNGTSIASVSIAAHESGHAGAVAALPDPRSRRTFRADFVCVSQIPKCYRSGSKPGICGILATDPHRTCYHLGGQSDNREYDF